MNHNTALTLLTRADVALMEANTIVKLNELKNIALTAKDWFERKKASREIIAKATALAFDAERKMGEMLAVKPPARGAGPGRGKQGSPQAPCLSDTPTIGDLGLTKRESAEAQRLAAMPAASFEAVRDGSKTRTQVRREEQREAVERKTTPVPTGKFRVIYADPPWKYGDTRDGLSTATGATAHYPTMTIPELCALPIENLAEDNAVLFLWVTSPLLSECWPVIKAWGFNYKTSFVWDKVRHNLGHYNSVRHELLLICTRGSCLPDSSKLIDSVQIIERSVRHSEKPAEFRRIIETMYTHGAKIELFAREKVDGWTGWGNECHT